MANSQKQSVNPKPPQLPRILAELEMSTSNASPEKTT